MSLRSGDERGSVADRCELGGECGGWADAANWRILAAGLLSPPRRPAGGVGRSHFPVSCLGILPLTDTPGYSVQTLGSTS